MQRHLQTLRRCACRRGGRPRDRAATGVRADRPERRRQDDARESHQRSSSRGQWRDPIRRRRRHRLGAAHAHRPRYRPHLSGRPALQGPDRAGERARRWHARMHSDALRRLWPRGASDRSDRERAVQLLERLGLSRPDALAGGLAYGDQRRLEIARALASDPRLLILDEPAAGMNLAESARLRELMRALVTEGLTIVLIEHDVRLVMGTCERVAVLNFGRKIAEGTPAEIQASPIVREAYLGSEDAA